MQNTIVPSANVGRWVDFEQLDFERRWVRSHSERPKRLTPQGEERTEYPGSAPLT